MNLIKIKVNEEDRETLSDIFMEILDNLEKIQNKYIEPSEETK